MDPSAPTFSVSQTLMYVSLGLFVVSLLWAIAQSVMEAKGKVVSRSLWMVGPGALLTVGIVNVGRAMATTAGPLDQIPAEERQQFVAEGLSIIFNAGTATGLYLFAASAVGALGLGISTLVRADEANEETRVLGNGMIFAAGLGAAAFFVLGFSLWDAALADYFAAVGLALGGTGYGLVLLAGREEAPGVDFEVTNRACASLLVFTVIAGVLVTFGVNSIAIFKGMEGVEAANRASYIAEQLRALSHLGVLAGGPVVVAALMGAVGVIAAPDPVSSPNWMARLGKIALFLLPVLAALAYAGMQYPDFRDRVVRAGSPAGVQAPAESSDEAE